jgi:hypothetical protein
MEGLNEAKRLLVEFVEEKITPQEIRQHNKSKVDSGKRQWKIKSAESSVGAYEHPVQWSMTASDVVAGGESNYCDNVRKWVVSILERLKYSGNC